MEFAQSDAAAYMDWYRIETERAYLRPEDEVTGNPADNYERRPAGLAGMWEGVRYQMYEASDGHVLFMASEQAFWKNFCRASTAWISSRRTQAPVRRPRQGQRRTPAGAAGGLQDEDLPGVAGLLREWVTTIAPVNTTKNIGDDPRFKARMDFYPADALGCEQLPPRLRQRRAPTVPHHGARGRREHRSGHDRGAR